eukprot:gene4025-biopygen2501
MLKNTRTSVTYCNNNSKRQPQQTSLFPHSTWSSHRRDGYLIDIKATNPAADPLTYPLLFPFGEHGWGTAIARLPSAPTQIPLTEPNGATPESQPANSTHTESK